MDRSAPRAARYFALIAPVLLCSAVHAEATAPRAVEVGTKAPAHDVGADESLPPSAPPEPELWTGRRFELEGRVGLGTAVGYLGVVSAWALAPALSLGVGVGTGSGPGSGNLHAAVLADVRPFRGVHNALTLEGALSTGAYERFDPLEGLMGESDSPITRHYSARASWLQVQAGWEYRFTEGTVVRISSGLAWMLNPSSMRCTETSTGPAPQKTQDCGARAVTPETIETAEVALGHTF